MSRNAPQWRPNPDPASIVVPGLNTTAPIPDQVEQIDQLITLKLQKIDGQFARIQWLAEHKLLPAVKRYTNGVQPVREAAHFWVQFFEAAAHMRVPRQDDFEEEPEPEQREESSSSWEPSSQHSEEETTAQSTDSFANTPPPSRPFDPNVTPSESSFMPGHAAISSTPATTSKQRSTRKVHDQTPSWTSSIESSLSRLNDELDGLGLDEQTESSRSEDTKSTSDDTTKPRDKGKGKARQPQEPLLRNVLKQNTFNTSDTSTGTSLDIGIPGLSSPLRQDAAKILARMNPYLPPNTQPSQWNSVVDLSTTRLATPRRNYGDASQAHNEEDDSFGSDPGLGLSPPVTIDWALPTKRQPAVRQTPKKEAAARIGRDLISNLEGRKVVQTAQSNPYDHYPTTSRQQNIQPSYSYDSDATGLGLSPPVTIDWGRISSQKQLPVFSTAGKGEERSSTFSSMSSPPSLTRYMDRAEGGSDTPSQLDLDSLMRRVGLDFDVKSETEHSLGGQYLHTEPDLGSATDPVVGLAPPHFTPALRTPSHQVFSSTHAGNVVEDVVGIPETQHDYNPDLSDSFEDEQPNDTINPSGAFLLASQRRPPFDDDSFESGDSFSGDEDGGGGGGAVHPFAALGQEYDNRGFDDDSFDDTIHQPGHEDTETIFGARHAQALNEQNYVRPRTSQQLKLLGEDLVEETQRYGYTASSQESPTPATRSG